MRALYRARQGWIRLLSGLLSLSLAAIPFLQSAQLAEAAGQKIYYFHPDQLGSTSLVTDERGQVVQEVQYLPYGATWQQTGSANLPQKFTGQRLDDSSGLYFYNARYYDPQLGRFTQPDTIVQAPADPQTLNRYSYARNNPLKYTDPSGHSLKSLFQKAWGRFTDQRKSWWEQHKPRPDDPSWWFKQLRPATPVHPDAAQQFNQALNATATFLVNQWGFSPAAANATIGAVLAIPTGGNSLIAAGLAYGTTELLGTGEARQIIGSLAGFFEQFGISPEASRMLATQVVSAGVAVGVSVASAAARELYVKVVRYQPTWAKGGLAVPKGPLDLPRQGANNVFNATRSPNVGFCCAEGGLMSRLANQIPGINATSGMHDMFQIGLQQSGGNSLAWALNVPGMPPAAALTYMSLVRPQEASIIYGTGSYGAQDN